MLKKSFLLLLFSVSLCAVQPLNSLAAYKPIPTHSATAGDLIIIMLGTVIIPNMLKDCAKIAEEKRDYKVKSAECLLIGAEIALFIYYVVKYHATEKAIYDYWHSK